MAKKKEDNSIVILGLIAIGGYILTNGEKIKEEVKSNLSFLLGDISYEIRPLFTTFRIKAKIQNDNAVGGTVNSFTGNLYYVGAILFPVQYDTKINIPAKATSEEIEIEVKVNNFTIVGQIINAISTKNKRVEVNLKGKLATSYGTFEVDEVQEIIRF